LSLTINRPICATLSSLDEALLHLGGPVVVTELFVLYL
jgi:hypothetical protein